MSIILKVFCFCAVVAMAVPSEGQTRQESTVTFKNSKGEDVGTASLSPLQKGTKIRMDLRGLPPGDHAIHFHEQGKCDAPDFKTAGEHLSLSKKSHGVDHASGPHEGDMPNLIVGADGTLKTELVSTLVTLNKKSLLRPNGTSLVIHSSPDDYKSQPAGDSGDRIACGVVK